jgi:thymidylate kinase
LQPLKTRKTAKSYIGYLIKPRMWKKPDVSIFLDVSPEVAYERKQDYSFEKMLEVNKAYKDYMHAVDGVKIVDADQTVDGVRRDVIRLIKEHDSQCA